MNMSFDNLRLEKGMYRESGKSFTQVLEQLDPSENYRGTGLEGTDAFQRQLKRFDIKVKGAYSDPVEKFFSTMDGSVLFPEYISRAVRTGMDETNILPKITATTTNINALDYRSVYSVPDDMDKELARVAEGATIPATEVKAKENLVQLNKRGRMLVASYEAIRFQKLDLFSVTLRQIGQYIQTMHLQDAIEVLLNGDGNNNAAEAVDIAGSSLTYSDLVNFWTKFDPYQLNTFLCPNDVMVQMLNLSELQNPLTGLNFQGTGALSTPIGAELLRSSCVPSGQLIGLDRNYALEMVQAGDITVEYDKIIDRQLERAAITSISGFGKICEDAVKVLEL
ncbi:MAG: phage major capsid protein [Eubacteriales bacterium]